MKSRNPSLLSNSGLPRRAAALPKRPNCMIHPLLLLYLFSRSRRPTGGRQRAAILPDRTRRPLPRKPRAHGFSHHEFQIASLEPGQFLREHGHALPIRARHAGDISAPEATPRTEGVEYLLEIGVNVAIRVGLARIAWRPGKFDCDIGMLGECQQVAEISKSGSILAAGTSTHSATVVDVELQPGMTSRNPTDLGHMAAGQQTNHQSFPLTGSPEPVERAIRPPILLMRLIEREAEAEHARPLPPVLDDF